MNKCYSNIKGAFSASTLPPLGGSDHSVVYLPPKYQRLLERDKPQVKTVKIWNEETIECLQGCFDCTFDSVVSDYIIVCVESVTKTYQIFPNNETWV